MKQLIDKNGEKFPIVCNSKSLSIATKLKESLKAKTFVEMVIKDENVLRLLCIHRSSLSPFEKFNFPLLFSINRGKSQKSPLPFELIAIKEETKAQHTIERIIERAKPKLGNLFEKFMSKYGLLLQDIDAESDSLVFQEEREQQIIGIIISQIVIQEFGNEEKILKIIKMFEDFVIDDVVPVGLMIVDSLKKEFIDFGIKNREKVIDAAKLDEKTYEDIINKLEIKYKVIKPLISVFWCENERHDHYSFFMVSHSSVPEIKCPICNRKLSVGTFYYFIPSVNYLLRSKEGLIQSLVMYQIEKTGLEWAPGVYLKDVSDDTEKDIVVKKGKNRYILIEIKNFATDTRSRTKKENIKQLLNQALKHLDSYLRKNIMVEDFYISSNYLIDDEIKGFVDDLLSKKKFSKLNEVNLEIIGLNDIMRVETLVREGVEL